MTRCEVTVESQDIRRRQGHEEPVVALLEAFSALERQVEHWERRRRDAKRGPTAWAGGPQARS